jgi:hypothetical protein
MLPGLPKDVKEWFCYYMILVERKVLLPAFQLLKRVDLEKKYRPRMDLSIYTTLLCEIFIAIISFSREST